MPVQTTRPQPRWFLADLAVIHVRGEDTDGRLGIVEMTMPAGDEPPLHVHHDHDEIFCVLDGELTLYLPGQEQLVRAGEVFVAPRGIPHIYRAGERGARALVQSSPAGFEAFVEATSAPADGERLPDLAGPPTQERVALLTAAAAEQGIELIGPPGARP
jgi:quercetin dioxygenase-like cupin family protein